MHAFDFGTRALRIRAKRCQVAALSSSPATDLRTLRDQVPEDKKKDTDRYFSVRHIACIHANPRS
jgi:hypothetical protein